MNKGSSDAAGERVTRTESMQHQANFGAGFDAGSPLEPDDQALAQALVEEKDSESRTRAYSGPWATIISALALLFSLFQLAASTFWTMDAITLRAVHILFLLTLSFLLYPALRREQRQRRAPTLYDALCICAGLFSFGYLILNYTNITLRGGWFEPVDYVVASVGLLICFEMARRVVGNLAALALVFLAYNFFGYLIPGAFGHPGYSWNRVAEHMFWGSQGTQRPCFKTHVRM